MRDFGLSEDLHFGEDACHRDEFFIGQKNTLDEEEIEAQLENTGEQHIGEGSEQTIDT